MNAIPSWHDLRGAWRRIAVHEAGHAAIGEMCGYRVSEITLTDGVGGIVRFLKDAAPWVKIAAGSAGHAAEAVVCGRGLRSVSLSDRLGVSELFEAAGGDIFAGQSVEAQLAFLIATTPLRAFIATVARGLVMHGGKMTGGEFRRAGAEWLYDSRLRRRVRMFCLTAVRETLAEHQDD